MAAQPQGAPRHRDHQAAHHRRQTGRCQYSTRSGNEAGVGCAIERLVVRAWPSRSSGPGRPHHQVHRGGGHKSPARRQRANVAGRHAIRVCVGDRSGTRRLRCHDHIDLAPAGRRRGRRPDAGQFTPLVAHSRFDSTCCAAAFCPDSRTECAPSRLASSMPPSVRGGNLIVPLSCPSRCTSCSYLPPYLRHQPTVGFSPAENTQPLSI